jgi:hypothetical protein
MPTLLYPVVLMRAIAAALLLMLVPCAAFAQEPKPIPFIEGDVRIFRVNLKQDPATAASLGVTSTLLPKTGVGGVADLHLYVLRRQGWALGIDGEGVLAHGRNQPLDPTTGGAAGAPLTQQLQSLSGGLSLNFGHRGGWSYVSAGMGPMKFPTFFGESAPTVAPPITYATNFGGGARWFFSDHLAFCFDIRFYQTPPSDATLTYPARGRVKLMLMSAGIGIK